MKNIIIILFLLCIIGYICTLYENIHTKCKNWAKFYSENNPSLFYVITPLFFLIAAHTFLFKKANGPLMLHINTLFNDHDNIIKSLTPLPSLIMLTLGSLLAVFAGGALGSEAILVSLTTTLLLYGSYVFKNILVLNSETLLYIGYIFGFTIALKSPLSSLVLVIEKSVLHSDNMAANIRNVIYSCLGIAMAYFFTNDEKIIPTVISPKIYKYDFSSIMQYGLFALICGTVACFLFKFMYKMYFMIKKIYTNHTLLFNVIPLLAGLGVALLINKTGVVSIGGEGKSVKERLNIKNKIGNILNIVLTFISGCPGGLILPSISIGSHFAYIYKQITSLPLDQTIMVGMTSVFAAVFGYPLASAVIIKTILNQNWDSLPMLIICAYIANFAYKYIRNKME